MNCLLVSLLELLVWTQGNTESSQAHGPGNSETNGQEKLFWDTAATKKVKEKKFLCAFLGFISFSSQSQVVFSHPMPQARKFVIFAFKRNRKNECRLYEVNEIAPTIKVSRKRCICYNNCSNQTPHLKQTDRIFGWKRILGV